MKCPELAASTQQTGCNLIWRHDDSRREMTLTDTMVLGTDRARAGPRPNMVRAAFISTIRGAICRNTSARLKMGQVAPSS